VTLISLYNKVMDKKIAILSRPKDKSLEAYKAWIKEFTFRLTGKNNPNSMTEEQWVAGWKKFWSKSKEGA
jgi:hypothetical protein